MSGWDVFVSYAHDDNQRPLGGQLAVGWVTALAQNLNVGPGALDKRIFIDHQLKPGDAFSTELLERVARSDLLLLLLSQNYVESGWCGQELDHFVRTHANDAAKPADVFVVELEPFERLINVPDRLLDLRKRLIHAKFWHQKPDAAAPSLAGYPSPQESGAEGAIHYWNMLNELRFAIDERLRAHRRRPATAAQAPLPKPAEPTAFGTVLLADVTEDLEAHRSAVRQALEPEGIRVLPEGDYTGLLPDEFEAAIAGDLKQCALFVQLLSATPGRKLKGFAAPLAQLQFDRARASGVPIAQWCERLPADGSMADAQHARLFATPYLRATNLAAFKQELPARLRKAVDEAANRAAEAPRPFSREIFLDDLDGPPDLKQRLRSILRQENFGIRTLPPGMPLGGTEIDVKQVLKPCRAGLTVYADRARHVTVYSRLLYYLNQVAEGRLRLSRWLVCMEHGTVESEFGIESAQVISVNERELAGLLRGL